MQVPVKAAHILAEADDEIKGKRILEITLDMVSYVNIMMQMCVTDDFILFTLANRRRVFSTW